MLITKSPIAQPPFILNNLNAAQIPFIVRGASGQSASLQEWQNSASAILMRMSPTAGLFVQQTNAPGTTSANLGSGAGNFLYEAIRNNTGTLTIGNTSDNGPLVLGKANSTIITVRGAASQTSDIQQWQDSTPTTLSSIDKIGRIQFPNVEAITASAGAAAGTSPPSPVPTGNDVRGQVTFGTGTGPTAGIMAHVTFTTAFTSVPYISLTALNAATAALQIYPTNPTTTGFDIACGVAPAASQANTVYAALFNALG